MKSLKIGRNTSNDIILNDSTISAQHAILYIGDNHQYHIKDLNSTNGTFVNEKRVSEAVLKSSDIVRLGSYHIDWTKMINIPSKTVVTQQSVNMPTGEVVSKKKIGRSRESNEIVYAYNDVSMTHAFLIKKKNGDILLIDNNSTNGTYVNGSKISSFVLHKGDSVMIANKYPLNWEAIYPSKVSVPLLPILLSVVVAMAVTILVWWAPWQPWQPGKKGIAEEIYAYYNKSVVLIHQSYYFEVSVNNKVIGQYGRNSEGDLVTLEKGARFGAFGTGFFVSADGKIMTNRHVMNPYMTHQADIQRLKQYWQGNFEQMALALQSKKPDEAAAFRNAVNHVDVSIRIYSMGVVVNDTYVTSWDDFMPCTILGDSGSDDIDVGVIQLNSKRLPEGSHYVNLNDIDSKIVEGRELFTIGFPHALVIGTTSQGVEAQKQSGHISQVRGNIEFGHNLNIDHGSSGSPIFSDKGLLLGVVNAGFLRSAGNFNVGIQAKHAVKLLNKYK